MGTPAFTQVSFRWRSDNGSETGAAWIANQNAGYSNGVEGNTYRIRFRIDETGGSYGWTSYVWNLYAQKNGAGGYAAVTASTAVQFKTSSYFADGDDCTAQLTGGTGTFVTDNNGMKETTGGATNSGTAGYLFELEWCIYLDPAQMVPGDYFDLRVYRGTTALTAYSATPRITTYTPPAGITVSPTARESAADSVFIPTTELIEIRSNTGMLKTGPVVDHARVISKDTAIADADVVLKFKFPVITDGATLRLFQRTSNNWSNYQTPTSGYEIAIPNTGNYKVHRIQSTARTQIGSTVTKSYTADTWYTVRFRAQGYYIRARIWASSGSEPGTWDIEVNDTSGFSTSGNVQLGYFWNTVPSTVYVDDYSYGSLGTLVEPSAATTKVTSVAPTTVKGSTTFTGATSSAKVTTLAPAVSQSSISITPAARTAATARVDPYVPSVAVTVAPSPSTAKVTSTAPSIIYGSVTVTNRISSAATAVYSPAILYGSVVLTTTPSYAATSRAQPTVLYGSTVALPTARTTATTIANPQVIMGSASISPAARTAATAIVNPSITIGGGGAGRVYGPAVQMM
jgi:hypothetical protein